MKNAQIDDKSLAQGPTSGHNFQYSSNLTEKETRILKAVETAAYPITPREIATITKIKGSTVRDYLRRLEKKGLVRRKHHGHYVSCRNPSAFESSVVGDVSPLLHSVRLRFDGVNLEARCWVVDYEVVRVSYQVFGNRTALAFVDCVGDVSLDYPAFRLVLACVFRELGGLDWRSCEVTNFEFNCDYFDVQMDGVKAVTLRAFDGSFHRIYNKRFGVRDEVKVVGSRRVEDVLALMQGGVSTYNIMQLLFANFQKIDELVECQKFQNRVTGDAVGVMRRFVDSVVEKGGEACG